MSVGGGDGQVAHARRAGQVDAPAAAPGGGLGAHGREGHLVGGGFGDEVGVVVGDELGVEEGEDGWVDWVGKGVLVGAYGWHGGHLGWIWVYHFSVVWYLIWLGARRREAVGLLVDGQDLWREAAQTGKEQGFKNLKGPTRQTRERG